MNQFFSNRNQNVFDNANTYFPSNLFLFGVHKHSEIYSTFLSVYKRKSSFLKQFLIILFLFLSIDLFCQDMIFDKNNYKLEISKTTSEVKIDGMLDEWSSAGTDANFWLHYPIDTGRACVKSKISMMYDETYMYFSFVSYEVIGKPVVQSLKRDDEANTDNNDGITIIIDPSNTAKNGYYFRVNAAGALADGTVFQNGMYPAGNIYWDNKWMAKVRRSHDTLYYEIAIPFNAIKYNGENNVWGINFLRSDINRNKTYAWTLFPANKHDLDLGYTGILVFTDGLSKSKSGKIILMPSVSSRMKYNREESENISFNTWGSLNAKVSISSLLNLDLSVYPDFSNVEVDQQYIDFYRFEYYQPEQRSFFLENNDLFSNFGTYDDFTTASSENRVKPVYTRRIGKKDDAEVPIVYGVRLSGEVGGNTRMGLLNIQTESLEDLEPQNYFIGSFQKGVFKRSSIKGLFTNKNSTDGFGFQKDNYNRTGGLEFDYSTKDGRWAANAKMHSSFTNEKYSNNMFYGGGFTFFNKKFKTQNWFEHVGKNYITDIGFVPRLYYKDPSLDTTYRYGYTHLVNKYELYHFLNNKWITVMGEYTNIHTYLNDNNKLNEFSFDLGYWSVFSNRTHIVFQTTYNKFDLLVPHNVLDNDNPVPAATYENCSLFFLYESDKRKKLKYHFSATYGGFYEGEKLTLTGGPSYTFQPFSTVSLTYNYVNIDLKNGYGKATYHLISLKPEFSFSTKLLWTNLIQYNTQMNNICFNSIFQWRYAPMSDFYLIVKDNLSRSGMNKEFELSFKLSYWLNI